LAREEKENTETIATKTKTLKPDVDSNQSHAPCPHQSAMRTRNRAKDVYKQKGYYNTQMQIQTWQQSEQHRGPCPYAIWHMHSFPELS
jgi:outer membrane protein assembly factor BamA